MGWTSSGKLKWVVCDYRRCTESSVPDCKRSRAQALAERDGFGLWRELWLCAKHVAHWKARQGGRGEE